ncbi:MAG: alpha/beta hydrolase [Spirochaetia bacterium]|nr:alpha/beta hydrolase [Spirochaetia bacterium]
MGAIGPHRSNQPERQQAALGRLTIRGRHNQRGFQMLIAPMDMIHSTESFTFRNLKLLFRSYGRGKKLPILFFHATGFSADSYEPLHRLLNDQGHPVFALNFMGHGGSDSTHDFKNWAFFGDQVEAFAQHLGFSEAIAVGHSIGGASVLHAAARPGNPFKKIVLLDPTVFSPFSSWWVPLFPNPLAKAAETRRSTFQNLRVVERSFRMHPLFKSWNPESFKGYLKSAFTEDADGFRLQLDPLLEAKIFRSFHRGQWHIFKKVKQPTLLITARASSVTPPSAVKRLIAQSNHSLWIEHPGSHCFPMEDPAGVTFEIERFTRPGY